MGSKDSSVNRKNQAVYRAKLRHDALLHYAPGGIIRCARCGCDDESLLQLHHKNGGGNAERDSFQHGKHKSSGGWIYCQWLKGLEYPPIPLEVLCVDCHKAEHSSKKDAVNMDQERQTVKMTPKKKGHPKHKVALGYTQVPLKCVKEDDEVVNFDLVEPAKNHKPWTPKYVTILSPLNNSKASRSVSGLNGDEDEDMLSIAGLTQELKEPREAIMYAITYCGRTISKNSRFDPDEVLDYLIRAGRPNGWVAQTEFIRLSGASKELLSGVSVVYPNVKPVSVGATIYYDPEWVDYVVAYKLKKASERETVKRAARAAYHPTSNGPLKQIMYSVKPHAITAPRPTWLTQAKSDGLFTSGDLAKELGVSIDTVRNWSDSGILKPTKIVPTKNGRGIRLYSAINPTQLKDFVRKEKSARQAESHKKRVYAPGLTAAAHAAYKEKYTAFLSRIEGEGKLLLKFASKRVGYSPAYIKKQVDAGKIKYSMEDRFIIISQEDIDTWKVEHEAGRARDHRGQIKSAVEVH